MDLMEWGMKLEDLEYKVVARDELESGVVISTVWLGLDHQWGDGPPLIFETMVFGGPNDQDQYRYSTEDEARAGHAEIVRENNVIILTEVKDRRGIEA